MLKKKLKIFIDLFKAQQTDRNPEHAVTDILESMSDGFISLDKDFRILRVNRHQEKISGLNRNQTVGRIHWDIWPKEIVPNLWVAYHKAVKDKISVHLEDYISHLKIWISIDAFPTLENGLAVFFRDITKEKFATQALQNSEAQFRNFADSMPQLAWIAHANGSVYWNNQGWYDYTGTSAKDIPNWEWQSVHDPLTLPKVLARWTESITTGKNFEMTFPIKGADGKYISFLTRITPVRDADG